MGKDFEVQKLRGSENYHTWQFAIKNLLEFKGLHKCLNTKTIAATSTTAARTVCAEDSEEKQQQAKSLIILSLDSSIFVHVIKCKTAIEVWTCLQKLFEDKGLSRKIGLLRQLIACRLDDSDGMQTYIDNVISTSNKLTGIGFDITQEWIGAILLAGLTEEYRPLIMSIEASDQNISADSIVSKLIDMQPSTSKSGEAFLSKKNRTNGSKKEKEKKKKIKKCFICKSTQHLSNVCPERKSGPTSNDDKKEKKKDDTQCAFIGIGMLSLCERDEWYIDSGASSHMSPFDDILIEKQHATVNDIKTANDARLKVECMGKASLNFNNKEIIVNDILHIPDMSANLLSVYKMVSNGNTVVFDSDGCKIFNQAGELLLTCKPNNGVYKLKARAEKCLIAKRDKDEKNAMLWHRRYGHLNFQALMQLKTAVSGIAIENDDSEIINCKVCPMGKQKREKFDTSTSRTTKELELVHSDVCGPMETKTIGGARYMLTFTDDYTRKTFVYFLAEKTQVLNTLIEFKNFVEKQTGERIKTLRTDNGTEYISNAGKQFFRSNGIMHQLTCVYTPQQNGVAERANRTLIERARCMMFDANLDKKFWAEACHMAAYLMNRTPRKLLDMKTPEEMWTGHQPDVTHLRIFGSKVMVHIPKEKRSKLSSKSSEMIFVGYDSQRKGYRCYDPDSNQVIASRDVKFFESPSSTVKVNIGDEERKIEEANDDNTTDTDAEELVEEELADNTLRADEQDDSVTISDDGSNDPDYTSRVQIRSSTPRRGTRDRTQVRPFQVTHFALLSTEPATVEEAMNNDDADKWLTAMNEEIASHEQNNTWSLVDLPAGRKPIKAKWVFKIKTVENEPVRFKARLVAKGCGQKYGVDYTETFAPVVRHNTIRFLMAMAVKREMKVYQMDVITAFLQGDLNEEIFMLQPEKFNDGTQRVCKLNKAVYGLKQAGRQWNLKLDSYLISIGFSKSQCDPCVYVRRNLILAIYVDDFLIFYVDEGALDRLRRQLHHHFRMKDIGLAKNCLGIHIKQGNNFIELDQIPYVLEILRKFGMTECRPCKSPSATDSKLTKKPLNQQTSLVGKVPYQEVVGSLLYLANSTRPDISYATSNVSRFNADHTEEHWTAVKRILRYLKHTSHLKLRFERNNINDALHAYCDADWGSGVDDRKSRTGYVLKLSGAAVSWMSKRQSIVALSSTEAEYIALSSTVREIIWTIQLAKEIGESSLEPITIFCDNQSAIQLASSDGYRQRTKHVDIRHHHIRDQIKNGIIKLEHVSTEMQTADSLTKAVTGEKTAFCAREMGLTK